MHCSLIILNNDRTFANLSELLGALLSARSNYRLDSRNSATAAIEIICSKTYFSLLYELFKVEVPKATQKLDCIKCFSYNSPLVINSQI